MQKRLSQKSSVGAIVLIFLSLALFVSVVVICSSKGTRTPVSLTELPDHTSVVCKYFDALSEGEYRECDSYLYDFSISDMSETPDTELGKKMQALLIDSYDYEILDEAYVTGMDARQLVRITYLDLNRLGDATIAPANAIAEELNYQGIDIFTEEMAMDIAVQALDSVVDNVTDYYVSGEFFIKLRYDGNEWQILYSTALEDMILGNGSVE